jgi:hypothetical protein
MTKENVMEKIAEKAVKFFEEVFCWKSSLRIVESDNKLIVQDEDMPEIRKQLVYVGDMSEALQDLRDDIPKKDFFRAQKNISLKPGQWRTDPIVLRMLAVEQDYRGELLKSFSAVRLIDLDDTLIIAPELTSYHEGEIVRSQELWTKKALIEAVQDYDATVMDFI